MEAVSAAASLLTIIEVSLKVASLCAEYHAVVKKAKPDIERFRLEVEAFIHVLQSLEKLLRGRGAERLLTSNSLSNGDIQHCLGSLELLHKKLDPGKSRATMSRYGFRALKWPFEKKELEKDIGMLERYKNTFNAALNVDQTSLILDIDAKLVIAEHDQRLSKLSYAVGANFDSYERQDEPYCLPNTRVDILEQIMKWSADPSQKALFWLNGMAGTGKSTIARTVARTLKLEKRLAANFFFSRGRGDLSHSGKLFSTIAVQLAATSRILRRYICEAIAEHDNISQQSMRDQWINLIYQPLLRLGDNQGSPMRLIFVLDALDECERQQDIRLLLLLLTEDYDLKNIQLRVLLTSRPETPIRLGFRSIPTSVHEDFVLHDISTEIVSHDIAIFLRDELDKIRQERMLPHDWPEDHKFNRLVDRSGSLFVYAATACRFIKDLNWLPERRLDIVLQGDDDQKVPMKRLDHVYIHVLRTSVLGECHMEEMKILAKRFRDTVGTIITLFDSLSSHNLKRLYPALSETIDITLSALHSVLNVPGVENEPIQLLHPSFRDFLVNKERCTDDCFWIDQGTAHREIAKQCIGVMSRTLKRNICNLETPGILRSDIDSGIVHQNLPHQVQYACEYWLDHAQKGALDPDVVRDVYKFLQTHFLHWLEALSLMGKLSKAIINITELSSVSELQASSGLMTLIGDARRFVLEFRYIVEMSPLQIYNSALIFCPEASIIRDLFSAELPTWIERPPDVGKHWTPCLQTLEGHLDRVVAITYSPDGQLLASMSYDQTIRVWNAATGASLNTFKDCHWQYAHIVLFSPDGQLLIFASDLETTIKMWNPVTGVSYRTLEGHSARINAVAFSPNSHFLASASSDATLRLWDPIKGICCDIYKDHQTSVTGAVFSGSNQRLVSGSLAGSIVIRDLTEKVPCVTVLRDPDGVTSVNLSPDDVLLASATSKHKIKLWNLTTKTLYRAFDCSWADISRLTFSPDNQFLACAYESALRVWNTSTGFVSSETDVTQYQSGKMVVSLDSQLMAVAHSGIIYLQHLATNSLSKSVGYLGTIIAMAFNGQILATASTDSTIRLWDLALDFRKDTFQDHPAEYGQYGNGAIRRIFFSPDHQLLATISDLVMVSVWDPITGDLLRTFKGRGTQWKPSSLAFSYDSQFLASAFRDGTIELWNPVTGDNLGNLRLETATLPKAIEVAFSPKNYLASGHESGWIGLWNPITKESIHIFRNNSQQKDDDSRSKFYELTFSPDCSLLANVYYDGIIELWDMASPLAPQEYGTLNRSYPGSKYFHFPSRIAFSPNGVMLACAYDDEIQIWNIRTRSLIRFIDHNYSGPLSFNKDGSHLIMDGRWLRVPECPDAVSDSDSPINFQSLAYAPCSFHVDGEWLYYEDRKVLWLPPDCRPGRYAVHDRVLMIGNRDGRTTFFRFSATTRPFYSG